MTPAAAETAATDASSRSSSASTRSDAAHATQPDDSPFCSTNANPAASALA
jgi:hypothetical protein